MGRKNFYQKQKLAVLKSAAKMGVRKAAELAGVHYSTVYEWRRQYENLGVEAFLAYKPSYPGRGIKWSSKLRWRRIHRVY